MAKSTTDDYTRSSERRPRSSTVCTHVPGHFAVHKPGYHFESCCGACNLFPGVLLIAFSQVLVGSILLTLILTHGKQYDLMHQTQKSQFISLATGAVLSGVTGAGVLLIIVALTENCRAMLEFGSNVFYNIGRFNLLIAIASLAVLVYVCQTQITTYRLKGKQMEMMVYLMVALLVWLGIVSLAIAKVGRACVRFKEAPKIKDDHHRVVNLACVSGLLTFLGAVVYFFSFMVVFSFYHFRYVRRAILMHEAECE